MVFVTFNYRLGAFGFLALDVLSFRAQEGVSGNYGFLDQTMALMWLRDNIQQFGGDPDKVNNQTLISVSPLYEPELRVKLCLK